MFFNTNKLAIYSIIFCIFASLRQNPIAHCRFTDSAVLAAAAERHSGPVGTRTGRHHRGSFQRAAAEGNPAGDQQRADPMYEAGSVHDCPYVERIDILL